jgi:hypothetical protein
MSWQVKLIALVISAILLGVVFELVRTRRLREEYSLLWFLTGVAIVLMTVFFDVLVWLTRALGSVFPSSIFFFFALVFLMGISLHYAIRVSRLTTQLKNLAQQVALLEHSTRGTATRDSAPF